jgi:aspartyl-tRNA(Asn)/glutamyl-tRNA(Gln) amidotransferase subunit B
MSQRKCVSYKVLVGLEIHVQLATRTKMFTSVANASGSLKPNAVPPEPNTAVDPVILGLPGVLPVINKKAVEYSVMVGLAMGCEIASYTKWDRKSYYYPDLPKNYQISQYDLPLCGPGTFEITDQDGSLLPVRIRRAHLEEDAGKLMHEAPGGYHIDHSIVDLNRAGTPLLEIVTEPDMHTPFQVAAFGKELQKLVQFLGVSEGQMQLGHMRFEPNINVHITDQDGKVHKTAITEIKNLNSFEVLEKATTYEIQRQIRQWESTGDLGRKSTYGWDDVKLITVLQRTKEEAADYRYFPDPDLVPVEMNEKWLSELKSQIGELPRARKERYTKQLGLTEKDAATLLSDKFSGDFFDTLLKQGVETKRAGSLMEALREICNDRTQKLVELGVKPEFVVQIGQLVQSGKIAASKEISKQLINAVIPEKGAAVTTRSVDSAEDVAKKLNLIQSTDTGAIDAVIDAVLAANPPGLADYKAGKQSAMGSLIGAVMKQGKGMNPKLVGERLKAKLG